jgi:hypothetical protein
VKGGFSGDRRLLHEPLSTLFYVADDHEPTHTRRPLSGWRFDAGINSGINLSASERNSEEDGVPEDA